MLIDNNKSEKWIDGKQPMLYVLFFLFVGDVIDKKKLGATVCACVCVWEVGH